MEDGVQVIRDYLGAQGLTDFELLNPSGLSRKNKFKAIHFYEVLKKTHASFGLYPEFLASLPIGGVDGTLKNRLNGLDEKVHVRAKTGQLSGVIGLAGFIGRDDGEQFAFVFLYNGDNSTMFKAKDLFDQLTIAISNR
jgi:D-alanyl-D-alanine carboxypeptidase/D-alanyl-D-alanine-endopeptidase (penicillin-binding protein 4)